MKEILMIYLDQFILRLYQTYKSILEKVLIGLLIRLWMLLIFQSIIFSLAAVISNYQKN